MIGRKFERLTVLSISHKDKKHRKYFNCICDCGTEKVVRGDCLTTRNTLSCGCLNRELSSEKLKSFLTTHNGSHTRLHKIWSGMKYRTKKGKGLATKVYGDRGISLCEEWKSFENFRDWALSHEYSDELTIERKDVNGDYCPENCCFIPFEEQLSNKQNTLRLTHSGVTKTMKQWAKELGLNYHTVYYRSLKTEDTNIILAPTKGGKVL